MKLKSWLCLVLVLVMGLALVGNAQAAAPDLSKKVNITYYLWGSAGVANADILAAMNEKLLKDLNCTLEVKYIDWGELTTKYPLLFASGEKFDMSHVSPTAAVSYYSLAAQGVLVDLTDKLDLAPTLRDAIPAQTWAGTKHDGRIYGVPTLYSEFTPDGYAYRDDLREKYGLEPINSLETLEAYFAAVAKGESFPPINGQASDATQLYRMLLNTTGEWIMAPGIPQGQLCLAAVSPEAYLDVFHPAFTEEFTAWALKMREWADAGYWQKDILASQTGAKVNLQNGISAGFLTHMPDWTGTYGANNTALPGVKIDWWSPAVVNGKVLIKAGVDNSTAISITSENPDRALMVIEKFMTEESYYRLMQNGIEGRQYEIVDGLIKRPAKYDATVDGGGFAAWSLRNDAFNVPLDTEDPIRYELIDAWKQTAIPNPFSGFSFNPSNVSNELAAVADVNAEIGNQILLGKTTVSVEEAVKMYRDQLKQAGIETIIAEVKAQLANFTPIGK